MLVCGMQEWSQHCQKLYNAMLKQLVPLHHEEHHPPDRLAEDDEVEWVREGRLVVAGDGACEGQGTSWARAGCGRFFGMNHSHNSDRLSSEHL